MGLYGSPDLSNKKTKPEKQKEGNSKFKKIFLWILIIINILLMFIGGINKFNILGILGFDCILIFIYSLGNFIYSAIKKKGFKKYILAMILSFIMFFIFSLSMGGSRNNPIIASSSKEQKNEDKLDYISLAETYEYKDIERNPDKYKGHIAVVEGKVIQVSELGFNEVAYRVSLKDSEDNWNDTVYVAYKRKEGESRVLEEDIITIYGELNGVETYASVMAGNITIPSIIARYIDINE